MKKLYIKQFGLILTVILIIGEIIFVNYLYPKREFTSDITERHFYEYMDKFSGKLTTEKEAEILAEQERIVDARNKTSAIEKRLYNGEYPNEEAFAAEYEENRLITERKEAFDLIFEQYSYALGSPNDRYLTVGDYSGMTADFPDVLLLALVIFLTAILFLNEESSGVITFVRISANGKQKTFFGKLAAISSFILSAQIFRTVLELLIMISRGDIRELSYPIRTIEFFQTSPYNVTILQGFMVISALRLLGYLFVAALIILLSVTLRKALFTIFIPSAVCLLQQFAFDPATPAYYIPTGFLRGMGYLRGSLTTTDFLGEEIEIFSRIPLSFLIILVIATIVFIAIALKAAYNYYSCKRFKPHKRILAAITAVSLCGALSGCTHISQNDVKFNLRENMFFTQNANNFYISTSENILQISKDNEADISLIHRVFDDSLNLFFTPVLMANNNLYYLNGMTVNALSLSDYSSKKVYSEKYFDQSGFLDIKLTAEPDLSGTLGVITGFFTDGKIFYYIYGSRVYKNGKCIINDDVYGSMISFDGRKIYYINELLQLKCYDTATGEIARLPGEFVRSIYYDGTRLLFSDKNGIFALNSADNTAVKISDFTAKQITSDGENIVCLNGGKLYLLKDTPVEVYDGKVQTFAILSGTHKLAVIQHNGEYELLDFLR